MWWWADNRTCGRQARTHTHTRHLQTRAYTHTRTHAHAHTHTHTRTHAHTHAQNDATPSVMRFRFRTPTNTWGNSNRAPTCYHWLPHSDTSCLLFSGMRLASSFYAWVGDPSLRAESRRGHDRRGRGRRKRGRRLGGGRRPGIGRWLSTREPIGRRQNTAMFDDNLLGNNRRPSNQNRQSNNKTNCGRSPLAACLIHFRIAPNQLKQHDPETASGKHSGLCHQRLEEDQRVSRFSHPVERQCGRSYVYRMKRRKVLRPVSPTA